MAGRRKQVDPRQLTLDGLLAETRVRLPAPAPDQADASLDIDRRLRAALAQGLKNCPTSRAHVAAEMSRTTGAEITKFMVDAWTGESRKKWRFPAEYLPAFIAATGHYALLTLLAEATGCEIVAGEDVRHAEIGRLIALRLELEDRLKNLGVTDA